MRMNSSTRYATLAALVGALACASNKARTEDTTQPEQTGAARDTTTTGRDTLAGRDTTQNPPGYRGMERDTTMAPATQPTASDTFLQKQGQGTPQDTAGYSGAERVDTTGQHQANPSQANPSEVSPSAGQADTTSGAAGVGRDTSGVTGQDTSGMSGMDTTRMRSDSGTSSSGTGLDSTGMSKTGDTTGYGTSQDTTTSR
jgi:hypothetical protein